MSVVGKVTYIVDDEANRVLLCIQENTLEVPNSWNSCTQGNGKNMKTESMEN